MHPLLCEILTGGLSLDFAANPPLQSVTLYLLLAATVSLGAAAVFFFLMREEALAIYHPAMVVLMLTCTIGCCSHWMMSQVYLTTGGTLPVALRSICSLFTTPLFLLVFPLLTDRADRPARLFLRLAVPGMAMVATAFMAESSPVDSYAWWTFLILSCLCQLLIVGTLWLSFERPISEAPSPLSSALDRLRLFVLIGWSIYPIGFLLARSGLTELREIVYNVADIINTVGFGLVAWHGIEQVTASLDD